jgi:dienelactone hydrolase
MHAPTPRGRRDRGGGERDAGGARSRLPRRPQAVAAVLALLAAVGAVAAIVATNGSGSGSSRRSIDVASTKKSRSRPRQDHPATQRPPAGSGRYAVGVTVLHLLDTSRTAALPSGPAPRKLITIVRYPASGAAGTETTGAPAARARGPYPLLIFGHGFAVTPALYAPLLRAWAEAGYVVAAPVFPLENANAPGGPTEADLTNQPQDMSFVITHVLEMAAAGTGPLAGLVDPNKVAVSGQSDGGDTALAVTYDKQYRDPRVKAAIVLSGAEMPGVEGWEFQSGEPPLLATQGTADTVNPPELTNTFFAAAAPPKYLLALLGAEHLPPYSRRGTDLNIVEAVTIAFLDAYVKGRSEALARMGAAGNVAGSASLTADP